MLTALRRAPPMRHALPECDQDLLEVRERNFTIGMDRERGVELLLAGVAKASCPVLVGPLIGRRCGRHAPERCHERDVDELPLIPRADIG